MVELKDKNTTNAIIPPILTAPPFLGEKSEPPLPPNPFYLGELRKIQPPSVLLGYFPITKNYEK